MNIQKYYENNSTYCVNNEPLRSYYIPLSIDEDINWTDREQTKRFYSLNGEWKFAFYKNIYDCSYGFYKIDFNAESFDNIMVPSCWQTCGYDQNQYTNTRYPFPFDPPYVPYDNPCGAYVKEFIYHKPEGTSTFHLNFEGVDSCCYVWLNGIFVGYHQVSHSTAEYDITNVLNEGKNKLAVLVLKWCDGSYLEDQDKFRMNGIFRDVYILARPYNYIEDYFIKTTFTKDYKDARVNIELTFMHEIEEVAYILRNPKGNVIHHGTVVSDKISFDVMDVILWNAEQPNLYEITLFTKQEMIRDHIGFREIEIRDSIVYLNGQKIRFRGANRHDSDPVLGSAVDIEHIIKDLSLMKQHNFNAIRTSHYPNMPEFYELCDKYGFYVIDEADIEVHGVVDLYNVNIFEDGGEHTFLPFISDNAQWTDAILNRVQKLVIRDKNRPCVMVWSMGNESGYGITFETALAWTKQYDASRLTHYEGSLHRPKDRKNDYSNIDLRSRMYASIPEMHDYLSNNPDKPFIQCEYIHAMGNGPGDVEDYYQLEEMYDEYVGGFVWEWADSTIYVGTDESGVEKHLYGGDSLEYPHDGNFCVDGIVKSNRDVTTGLLEYKNVHRPVRIRRCEENESQYIIQNKLDFMNLKNFLYIRYQVLNDDKVVYEGSIDDKILDVPARTEKRFSLQIDTSHYKGKLSIVFYSHLKHSDDFRREGHALGFDQIFLRDGLNEKTSRLLGEEKNTYGDIYVTEDLKYYYLTGKNFKYTFNKWTGLFDAMVMNGISLLEKPMELNIWRAPTDNDRIVKRLWFEAGYDMMQTRAYDNTYVKANNGSVIIHTVSSMAPVYRQRFLDFDINWTVSPDGIIAADMQIERNAIMRGQYAGYFYQTEEKYDKYGILDMFQVNEAYLPRLGVRLFLPRVMNQVDYFGYGPYESYIDKHHSCIISGYSSSVENMYEDYIRPQENGSHYCCEYAKVSSDKIRLNVYDETPFSLNVSEYTQEELTRKDHNYELEKSDYTILCIDYGQSGIGSGSCGPQLADQYRLNQEHFNFSIHFKPEVH